MMTSVYSIHPKKYVESRPLYPAALFKAIGEYCIHQGTVWDCATGNGQAALSLSTMFENVYATDISQEQLSVAYQKDNIRYLQAAEQCPQIQDQSIDCITVATAIHWLDRKLFFKECDRVLKRGGVLACWGYNGWDIHERVGPVIYEIIREYLMPYYPENIHIAFDNYKDVELPYTLVHAEIYDTCLSWSYDQLKEYMLTWSSSQKFIEEHGYSPLEKFEDKLSKAWGNVNAKLDVCFKHHAQIVKKP